MKPTHVILFSLLSYGISQVLHTNFACQGMQMVLYCSPLTYINIVSVKYGKYPQQDCVVSNDPQPDTSCISLENRRIKDMCDNRAACTVKVTSKNFHINPCPVGLFKRAEVTYKCLSH